MRSGAIPPAGAGAALDQLGPPGPPIPDIPGWAVSFVYGDPQVEQRHHTFSPLPGSRSAGVRPGFLVGCHSAASCGNRSATDCLGGGLVTIRR
jgi:hypothetical protein